MAQVSVQAGLKFCVTLHLKKEAKNEKGGALDIK